MTKLERVRAAVLGQPVDRLPYSLWYHFRLDPPAGERMAQAELAFYHRYDPDFLKVMHDVPYEMPADMPQVQTPDDWRRLPELDGVSGNFGAQLRTIEMILEGRGDDGPVIDTVFSVFSIAQKVSGGRTLEHLRADPDAVHTGLRRLTASLGNYARALLAVGAAGIYQAISGAASDTMDAEEYRRHFLAYDQQILSAAAGGMLNVVHQHGVGIYPDLALGLSGYSVYSWSNRLAGNPSIREMRLRTQACLMCGVDESAFAQLTPDEIVRQCRDAVAETNGRAFIVAPGCAVPTPPASPEANLGAFRAAVASEV
jgi:uroporphyrinogen decarboxylase